MKRIQAVIEILDPEEEQRIHDATLHLLATTGVQFPEQRILERFAAAGAAVNRRNGVVQIPESLVEKTLDQVRQDLGGWAQPDGASPSLAITITPQPFIADFPGQERRYGLLEDVVRGIAISNQMRHLMVANPIVVPSDVPPSLSDLFSYEALYTYAERPGNAYIGSEWSAGYIFEMAAVAGQQVTYLIEPVSPLRFTEEHLRLALLFAERGQRLSIYPMVIACLSGPVTMAGTLVVQNAEVLASLVLVKLLGAACNYRYLGGAHTMDLRTTMCSFGSPNQTLLVLAERQMARRYGLPTLGHVALTDAMHPDFQFGFEKGMSAGMAALAGVIRMGNQGQLGSDQAASLEEMLIDDEWADMLNYTLRGFEVSAETIGMDTIQAVGAGGSFLAEDHTLRYARKSYWNSDLFTRQSWDAWIRQGRQTTYDRAHLKVQKILKQNYPPPVRLDEAQLKEMARIRQQSIRDLEKRESM